MGPYPLQAQTDYFPPASQTLNSSRSDRRSSTRWHVVISASVVLDTLTNLTALPRHFLHNEFTKKQGQYIGFIHACTKINHRPPVEADMQRDFGVTQSTVHQMVLNLGRDRLIERIPGRPRSIRVLVSPYSLPTLK